MPIHCCIIFSFLFVSDFHSEFHLKEGSGPQSQLIKVICRTDLRALMITKMDEFPGKVQAAFDPTTFVSEFSVSDFIYCGWH